MNAAPRGFDAEAVRAQFPILSRTVHGKPLVYLDSAATTQKPRAVLDALTRYYERTNANIHRGLHALAEEATAAYEAVRESVARFIGAPESAGIVFVRNTTEAINLVAASYGARLKPGDEVVLTVMEHHSNLVPWQMLARRTGCVLRHVDVTEDLSLDMASFGKLLTGKTRIVAVGQASNAIGTIHPVAEIVRRAHAAGAVVLVDGAQGVPHLPTDVRALDCDFLAFSAHKMCGPTGVGVLYGKPDLLRGMDPFLGGGEMIREVHLDHATWNEIPWKFEAGTPNIADVVAFGEAIRFLEGIGMGAIREHERALTAHALRRLAGVEGLRILGPLDPDRRGGAVSFLLDGVHPHDVGTILDREGIAIRAGHHCAQPLMHRLGISATARASFYLYNLPSEVDALADALCRARDFFRSRGAAKAGRTS